MDTHYFPKIKLQATIRITCKLLTLFVQEKRDTTNVYPLLLVYPFPTLSFTLFYLLFLMHVSARFTAAYTARQPRSAVNFQKDFLVKISSKNIVFKGFFVFSSVSPGGIHCHIEKDPAACARPCGTR